MAEDMGLRIKQYIALRDKLDVVKERHDAEQKIITDLMKELEGRMEIFLDANNLESLKSDAGTCYKSVRYTTSVADPKAFMEFVLASERYDLLDKKANVTATKSFVAETKELPPGVNLNSVSRVNVRRPDEGGKNGKRSD